MNLAKDENNEQTDLSSIKAYEISGHSLREKYLYVYI